jgi:hypothetical protein
MTSQKELDELRKRLDQPPPERWVPSPADPLLIGQIIAIELLPERMDPRSGDIIPSAPKLTIKDAAGKRWSWLASSTVPRRRLAELRPKVGETIGAKFLGQVGTSRVNEYAIEVVGRDAVSAGEVDWSSLDKPVKAAPPDDRELVEDDWVPPSEPPASDGTF